MAKTIAATQLDFKDDESFGRLANIKNVKGKLKKSLLKARTAHLKAEWVAAVQHYNDAWKLAPDDPEILTLLAYALVQLGVRDKAIAVLEHVLTFRQPDETICGIMGMLASSMSMPDIAEKVWKITLRFNDQEPAYYVNLASALEAQEKYDEAIDLLQLVLPQFPNAVELWNVLGVVVMRRDGNAAARVFFDEGYKLDPKNTHILGNRATVSETIEELIQYSREGLAVNPQETEIKMGLAYALMSIGEVKEGFEHFEVRHNAKRKARQNTLFTIDRPRWSGEDITGKTLLVMCEQGIGDEILYSINLNRLRSLGLKKIVLTCDPRLEALYKNSYPDFDIYTCHDQTQHGYMYRFFPKLQQDLADGKIDIDYAVPLASLCHIFWESVADIPNITTPILQARGELQTLWKNRVKALSGQLKIGVSWSSGLVTSDRSSQYFSVEDLKSLLEIKDVSFVSLQYAAAAEGIAYAKERLGVEIHEWDDFKIKKDIESNIAIMSQLDLVVGPLSSPQLFGMAAGADVCWIATGFPAWSYGRKDGSVSFYSEKGRIVRKEKGAADWAAPVKTVADMVRDMLATKASNA